MHILNASGILKTRATACTEAGILVWVVLVKGASELLKNQVDFDTFLVAPLPAFPIITFVDGIIVSVGLR